MVERILVVDAVAANRIVIKVKLAAAEYEVAQAATLREAVTLVAEADKDRPALLVVSLPDAQPPSLAALTGLRRALAVPDLPILLILPNFDDISRRKALRAGADDVLRKPVEEEVLIAKVQRLLRSRQGALQEQLHHLALNPKTRDGDAPAPQINLVCNDLDQAETWRRGLTEHGLERTILSAPAFLLDRLGDGPQAHVIQADLNRRDEGLHLLCELKARCKGETVTAMLILPDGDHTRAALARELGASDVLFEPVDPAELSQRMLALLRQHQETEALRRSALEGLRMAMTDPLTGLSNRRHAMQTLPELMAQSAGDLALLMFDLDHFKAINDRHGHSTGDQVLVDFAETLKNSLPDAALIARYGGEEFLAALPHTGTRTGLEEADMVRRAVHRIAPTLQLPGLRISTSVGLAIHRPGESAPRFLARADAALYAAKGKGRDCIHLAAPEVPSRASSARLALLG